MAEPFIGSEALARGELNRHALRINYSAAYPDVYAPAQVPLLLAQRTMAAWLWSGRSGVVAGAAAAALHGSKWIDDDVPVELVYANPRAPAGVIARRETLFDDEVQILAGRDDRMLVTTAVRTAFDMGRRGQLPEAVARVDALTRATGLSLGDVVELARRHPHMRGLRQLERALRLVDPGAESPRETFLRLLLTDAGLPPTQTQIPVPTADVTYYLDMGWPDVMVAAEYDGEQHLVNSWQWRKDIIRLETLARMGWIVIRVIAADRTPEIVRRVRVALKSRDYRPAFIVR
ncbi:endonuclease domain-containing protein [Mycolicibacter senuensis]|uniref:endonuclease domain-containing protein n=1 Tax=Mycolicibacter senuensis TaxID=386913 RepID=UPI000DCDCA28|nr:hypothetical protein [Mycolicibacter senuensis]RAU93943.1 hypothetical protein DQP56_18400 [Mycolicibacter senuensis]